MRTVLSRLSPALVLTLLIGCRTSPPQPSHDAGVGTDAAVQQHDAGPRDAGAPDAGPCTSNDACNAIQYCDVATGECVPAKSCSLSTSDPEGEQSCEEGELDYCAYGGCYCDVNRGGGVCLPRLLPCAPCSSDLQCGADPNFYAVTGYTADCAAAPGADGTTPVCLPLVATGCPPGYVAGTTTTTQSECLPISGACGIAGPCTQDSDCDPASASPICDTASGKCIAACTFDYATATSSCPAGQVCHVDPLLLQPADNPNYGGGHCGPPCDVDGGYVCPATVGPEKWGCVPDGSDSAPAKQDRCRPEPPLCLRSADCPPSVADAGYSDGGPPDFHSNGFCVLATQECTQECATDSDCQPSYYCAGHECKQGSCVAAGGTDLACGLSQFCCGEVGAPSCPSGVADGGCFTALDPPWCGTCLAGQSVSTPGGAPRPLPSVCELGFQWNSCDPAVSGQCPHGWGCLPGPYFCTSDSDCGTGGSCGTVTTPWGNVQGCLCNSGATCPTGASCGMGTQSNACSANWCGMSPCFGTAGQ